MEALQIRGGIPLHGSVMASGAKNAITKMLVASLLSDKLCTFYNVPTISEVDITLALCREIGMHAEWDQDTNTLTTITKKIVTSHIPQKFLLNSYTIFDECLARFPVKSSMSTYMFAAIGVQTPRSNRSVCSCR